MRFCMCLYFSHVPATQMAVWLIQSQYSLVGLVFTSTILHYRFSFILLTSGHLHVF